MKQFKFYAPSGSIGKGSGSETKGRGDESSFIRSPADAIDNIYTGSALCDDLSALTYSLAKVKESANRAYDDNKKNKKTASERKKNNDKTSGNSYRSQIV